MEVRVLGPVEVGLDGRAVDLGTPKQRALVAALALSAGRPVSVDTIVDLLWGDDAPTGVTGTLQGYVAGLRRVLEPDRAPRTPAGLLVTVAPGYALRVQEGSLDAHSFQRAVEDQHARLQPLQPLQPAGPPTLSAGELQEAVDAIDTALAAWRGTPYAELDGSADVMAERTRLDELRLVALEDRAVAELALGHHGTAAASLEALTGAYPLRERLWGLRALALTRSGRQADALEVLRTVREVLADELGLEPGQELRDLQTAVLRQDEGLVWVAPPAVVHRRALAPRAVVVPHPREPQAPADSGWPMIGRDDDLARLTRALDTAMAGSPSYAVLTGEPGIGKTRLTAELAAVARARGVEVLVGRCSQDDGAPPLWPWGQVLDTLCGDPIVDGSDSEDEGARFRAWERITRVVRNAAAERPVLVVLDDLHWADSSSLRVLRLLAETATDEALMVVGTWRAHPEPTGDLASVAESLARCHALRVDLDGLHAEEVAEVFASVAHNRPSPDQAGALRDRTDGNPFFVVEYARLAGERTDLARLVAEQDPPAGVQDVLARRLARLPAETVGVLRVAAVIGRRFDAATLARAAAVPEDDLLDLVDPAQAAGMVREDGIDRFAFSHALVCDTLVTGLGSSRSARLHARVAEALDGPGRETEEARHWLAAGPAHAARAWRAAVTAAEAARRLLAHEQSAELLCSALEAIGGDPDATLLDRYDVLLRLIDAYRWSALWPDLTLSVDQAIEVAERLGDPELVARAAISTTLGGLWASARYGEEHSAIVAALRRCLDQLPTGDGALRARVMLALANETYYTAPFNERRELVDAALGMARRLDDEALLLDACQVGFVALWVVHTAPQRLAYVEESLELARRLGNERAYVVSACLRAVVLCELGRPTEMWAAVEHARAESERLRIPYGLLVLEGLVLPWHAMAGRFDACTAGLEEIRRLEALVALEQSADATVGAEISLACWHPGHGGVVEVLETYEGGPFPVTAIVVALLWRAGREEDARRHHATYRIDLDAETWFTPANWGAAAEVALYLEDAELGADVRSRLEPYVGRCASAGSAMAAGPVDAYLALSAAATGDVNGAARHADRAEELCVAWELPIVLGWLRGVRDRYGF